MQLSTIGNIIIGTLKIVADAEFDCLGLLTTHADGKMLSFIEKEEYLPSLNNNPTITCIISNESLVEQIKCKNIGIAISSMPRVDFFQLHHYLLNTTDFYYRRYPSKISKNSSIHPSVYIAAENVEIGNNCIIEQNVVIKQNVHIGNNVYIGAGTIIGGDGFECFRNDNQIINVQHAGGVVIKDNVSIHENVCIDKGLFRNNTIIKEYCSIDNFVHVAHNVIIGERTRIAANAVISGRTVVGHDVWIGPSVTISNGIEIGDNSSLTMGSIITKSVPSGKTVMWKMAF